MDNIDHLDFDIPDDVRNTMNDDSFESLSREFHERMKNLALDMHEEVRKDFLNPYIKPAMEYISSITPDPDDDEFGEHFSDKSSKIALMLYEAATLFGGAFLVMLGQDNTVESIQHLINGCLKLAATSGESDD